MAEGAESSGSDALTDVGWVRSLRITCFLLMKGSLTLNEKPREYYPTYSSISPIMKKSVVLLVVTSQFSPPTT